MTDKRPVIGFRVDPELRDQIINGAKSRNITVSEYVVTLLKAALKLKRFKDA